ncbi:carbohydrate-binding protein [Actinacidiphila paucisporea]|uniref:Tat pathway signal protein n=1 Tax=Actinacidiphila paucisporea TaxID=310782 RepID=UPI00190E6233|nr:Tat pathway signal protein [Actinacidiphila paucisporea]
MADPDKTLGKGWRSSPDRAVTAAADSDGLHVLVADSRDAYAWRTAAVLSEPGLPADTWIGNSCVIDPSHAAVAYAPRTFTNHEDLMLGGAFTAIIDLDKGTVTKLPFTASLVYFDPSCNPDTHTAAFTAYRDDKTHLVTVDTSGATVADTAASGQVTSAIPVADGTVAALGHHLVHIGRTGKSTTLATADSAPYDIHPAGKDKAGKDTYAFLDRKGDSTAHAKVWRSGRLATVATGKLTDLSLQQAGTDRVFLAGHPKGVVKTARTGITQVDAGADTQLSSLGRLAVDPVLTPGVQAGLANIADAGQATAKAEPAPGQAPQQTGTTGDGALTLTATATTTGKTTTQSVAAADAAPGSAASPALAGASKAATQTSAQARKIAAAVSDDHNPVDTDRYCSVPRNDVNAQALQPTPNQVEWAVDMAVRGNLTSGWVTQGGWRSQAGLGTISPQALFAKPGLIGGGQIPAQVELGILAQESNLWQAESGAIPGQMGNPLASVAGFYGHTGTAPSDYWKIDWEHSDCGYGVGQVTDGMRLAGHEKTGETSLSPALQKAVALDYTVNVAASLRILADKWNEVHTAGQAVTVNNDDASKPENWFTAVWNYNLGYNPPGSGPGGPNGPWGLGWYNNPANPIYPASRKAFMDTSLDSNANHDAAHPQDWPYEEKVMGWAAWSIDTGHSYATSGRQDWPGESGFSSAGFQPAWWISVEDRSQIKPPLETFCNESNDCDVSDPPPCETDHIEGCDELHWWHEANTVWKPDCADYCGHEYIKYQTLRTEPGRGYRLQYGEADCAAPPAGAIVVHSVPNGTPTWSQTCGNAASSGTFQFTFYPDSSGQYEAKGDLHQIGGGYQGHFWYAHARDKIALGGDGGRMTVLGTWSMNGPVAQKQAEVLVHVPDTGAQTKQAVYQIETAFGTVKRTLNQGTHSNNHWVVLGAYRFNDKTPQVSLSNTVVTGSGDDDVAYDAVAFLPGDFGVPDGPAIDLTLPNADANSPNPDQKAQQPNSHVVPPLNTSGTNLAPAAAKAAAKPSCGLVKNGAQACMGPALATAPDRSAADRVAPLDTDDWCHTEDATPEATRLRECDHRTVPAYLRLDGETQGLVTFYFHRELLLDGTDTFHEILTITPENWTGEIAMVNMNMDRHLCGPSCTPEDSSASWDGQPSWIPGDTHVATLTTEYKWDNSTAGGALFLKPDFQLTADIIDAPGYPTVLTGYQWSLDNPTRLDEVRCDTVITTSGGCVFVNYAPTYTFNAAKYPQAAAHAWLVQTELPPHPGVLATPLYYLPGGRDDQNRDVICDEGGWAAANGDPAVLSGPGDALNCDEFSFNASYNSGGMPASLGGLNPVSSGSECLQTYAKDVNGTVHLYNIGGYAPQWSEVCGRSAIAGSQNSGSMSQFGGFRSNMRLLNGDAYLLDTGITSGCTPVGRSLTCTMTLHP